MAVNIPVWAIPVALLVIVILAALAEKPDSFTYGDFGQGNMVYEVYNTEPPSTYVWDSLGRAKRYFLPSGLRSRV